MKDRLLKLGIAAVVSLAVPVSLALAQGPGDAQRGLATAAKHAQGNLPSTVGSGKPEGAGQPETAGERPHNHGWFVSEAAKDHSTTGKAHGEAVSKVARGNQGKPSAASQ